MTTIDLVHGVFNPTSVVLDKTLIRLTDKGYDLDRFTWIGSEACPFEYTNDPEVVIVLDVTLDTLQQTFEFAYTWAAEGQENGGWRWEGLSTDPDKLRLLEGSEAFKPMTLRWRRIKLNANIGKKPIDVRSPETSPGVVLVFVAAQHPARVKATDYKTRFGWFVSGIECTVPVYGPWRSVPCVSFNRGRRQVELYAGWYGNGSGDLAVPVFRE